MRCRRYIIATAYLPVSAAWTRTLRRLIEEGADIVSKDEVSRRIVVEAPRSRAERVVRVLVEEGATVGVEVKAACKGAPPSKDTARRLARAGFLVIGSSGSRATAYGVVRGRYVMVYAWGRNMAVKIGGRARGSRVSMALSNSVFIHPPEDVGSLLEEMDGIIEELRGIL